METTKKWLKVIGWLFVAAEGLAASFIIAVMVRAGTEEVGKALRRRYRKLYDILVWRWRRYRKQAPLRSVESQAA